MTAMAQTAAPSSSSRSSGKRALIWVAALAGAVAVISGPAIHLPGHHDPSATIAQTIGADSCNSSGYEITSNLTGSNTVIYDCAMPSGAYKCVTWQGGIAHDATATAKLLWADTLGSAKPICLQ